MKSVLITGGAGFIGSNLIRFLIDKYKDYRIINYDSLTYAGNLSNLEKISNKNYFFVKGDICDYSLVKKTFEKYKIDTVIHLAAESHVDRSIKDPLSFAQTNIIGTINLLEIARTFWGKDFLNKVFYHISTDEVYGSLGKKGYFSETSSYDPHSPYSASKASSDHFVRSYKDSYALPVLISNCSNNYGPYQFPEKIIPLVINNIINKAPIPIYGKGDNIRDWLYVEDHIRAIDLILHKGLIGETYLIGASNEWKNIDLVKYLILVTDKLLDRKKGFSDKLITYIKDRPGHDIRYGIDASKLKNNLGWKPLFSFEKGIIETINWYLLNNKWLKNVASGEYRDYYKEHYF